MTNSPLPTRNEARGFYGSTAGFMDADAAWLIAFPAVAKATGVTAEGVRDFLDSRHGRHFADDVHNGIHAGLDLKAAIDAAHARGVRVVALTGKGGGTIAGQLASDDIHLCVPADRTARIQEVHLLVIHCLCDAIDVSLLGEE